MTKVRFHEATELRRTDVEALQETVRRRVLRWFERHGRLEDHVVDETLSWGHGGGFSLDATVRIAAHDRVGLERLIRYCARPPFALERLEWRKSEDHPSGEGVVLYHLARPAHDGRTVVRLTPLELLDRLATLLPPPRVHRHRYDGVLAPNAALRPLVTPTVPTAPSSAPSGPRGDRPNRVRSSRSSPSSLPDRPRGRLPPHPAEKSSPCAFAPRRAVDRSDPWYRTPDGARPGLSAPPTPDSAPLEPVPEPP